MKSLAGWLVVLSLAASACTQKPAPVTAASGEQPAYAERYPARLGDVRAAFADNETRARTGFAEFKAYPDALHNPNWERVKDVVEKADEAGKSSAYSEAALEGEAVARFFREEKDGLRQKVAGAVTYAANQKQCSEDLGGTAVVAMERGVDKQLEERLRDYNDAQRYIDDHQEELGKPNVDTLQKQADKIAHVSNVVHVRLELYRREIEALLDDSGSVRSTLDRTMKESDATLADPNASKTKKAVAQRRRTSAEAALGKLDAEVEQGKRSIEEMQQRITALQKDYRTALDALRDDLDHRAENAPKK
jgi:hypothetical protein